MGLRDRLVARGKRLTSSGAVLRLVSNDTVMRVATGVMDARTRLANGNAHVANGAAEVTAVDQQTLARKIAARTSMACIGGRDVFEKCLRFTTADDAGHACPGQ